MSQFVDIMKNFSERHEPYLTEQDKLQRERLCREIRLDDIRKRLKAATPGNWSVRVHPEQEDVFFVEARTYEGHPYHGVTNGGFGILEDEDYPTKRADANFVANAKKDIEFLLELLAPVLPETTKTRENIGDLHREGS